MEKYVKSKMEEAIKLALELLNDYTIHNQQACLLAQRAGWLANASIGCSLSNGIFPD